MLPFVLGALAMGAVVLLVVWNRSAGSARPSLEAAIGLTNGFDLAPVTARYAERHGLAPEQAARIEGEFRRFFALAVASPRPVGIRSEPVDDYWHEAILFTRLYERLCRAVLGRFFHHDPTGGSEARYARTWAAYTAAYGEEPDPALWPRPEEAVLAHFTAALERERRHQAELRRMQEEEAARRAASPDPRVRQHVDGLQRAAALPLALAVAAAVLAEAHPAEASEPTGGGGGGGCGSGDGGGDGGGCGGGCGGGGD